MVINNVEIEKHIMEKFEKDEKVLSPGVKYRHYAPKTKCILVYGESQEMLVKKIKEIADEYEAPVILSTTESIHYFEKYQTIDIGSKKDLLQISHNIFSILRKVDEYDADVAIIEGLEAKGIGLAIMNRLIRACEYNYIKI